MKRKMEEWTVEEIYKKREKITFPDYQREPKLWSLRDKQLLIDSILKDIDIPKLYFYAAEKDNYEVVDGQQRLWAIWGYIDNEYSYSTTDVEKEWSKINGKKFDELPKSTQNKIRSYKLQITIIEDVTNDDLRELFLRLQFGLPLVVGEKLHASQGLMKDFIFKKMVKNEFIESISIPKRRFAKETLCTQICINSFARKHTEEFARTRYEDLKYFFENYKSVEGNDLKFFQDRCGHVLKVLKCLKSSFGEKTEQLKNRSFILSLYLFVEELMEKEESNLDETMRVFVKFTMELLKELKSEAKAGFDRRNKELYVFESYLSNAPGEKYQIKNRHDKLKDFFDYYHKKGKIKK